MVSSQQLHSLTRLALAALLAALVAGCAPNYRPPPVVTAEPSGPQAETRPEQDQDPSVSTAPRADASRATLALVDESHRARSQGDYGSAIAYVERAIRLEPKRGDLWVELGAIELARGAAAQAERYARKALSLSRDRLDWQRDAWLLIAEAKETQGKSQEAESIRARWRTLRG